MRAIDPLHAFADIDPSHPSHSPARQPFRRIIAQICNVGTLRSDTPKRPLWRVMRRLQSPNPATGLIKGVI
jgi:hypothetical protein